MSRIGRHRMAAALLAGCTLAVLAGIAIDHWAVTQLRSANKPLLTVDLALREPDAEHIARETPSENKLNAGTTVRQTRLVAGPAYFDEHQIAKAKALLIDTVENRSLAPGSLERRDSLFALGKLLHREAAELEARSRKQGVDSPYPDLAKIGLKDLEHSCRVYQEAVGRLGEAVRLFPDAPQAMEAHYLIAESHRQAANWPRKARCTIASAANRAALQRQARDAMSAAITEYESLLALLIERQALGGLSAREETIMRKTCFARADVLFELERFAEAIAAYSFAANRFLDRPEALEAFVQMASCYRRMNRPAEARETLERAKVALRRIPADAAFTQTTRYDRGEWTQLLSWLSSL